MGNKAIDEVFDIIDSTKKAYLLGLVSSKYDDSKITVNVDFCDVKVSELFKSVFIGDDLNVNLNISYNTLTISSVKLVEKLRIVFKMKDGQYSIPNFSDEYFHHFMRGVFEGNGYFGYNGHHPVCGISSSSQTFLQELQQKLKVQSIIKKDGIEISDNAALDFLNDIYKDVLAKKETLFKKKTYEFYKQLAGWMPNAALNPLYFNYVKTCPEAKPPQKQRASDSGYDLTLMKKIKVHGNVEFYDTCIKLQPTFGYYFDLVGRSSISKSGYMLANNIGIIDRTYQGSVIVPLIKLDNKQPDLELPCRLVQIIPRQIHHLEPIEITEEDLTLSDRRDGGFGSTGK